MFYVAVVLILASLLVLYRAIVGPRFFDRVLAANAIGTKTVILLVLFEFIEGTTYFVDIALVYALINFIVTLAILKTRETGKLG